MAAASRRGTSAPLVKKDQRSFTHERGAHATFDLARMRKDLKPFKLHWFPAIGSTNSHAAKMRRENRLLAPAVLLTGRQTAGRGRGSNVWHSPRGVITASFVLSAHDTLPPQHVPLVAGQILRDVIDGVGIPGIQIKWPNDLWHRDRKVAGLLCERFGSIDVIGVGLNANVDLAALPRDVGRATTSLHKIAGRPVDQTDLVIRLAHALYKTFADPRLSLASIRDSWLSHDALAGRKVRITQADEAALEGIAAGIDAGGKLLIRKNGGKMHSVLNGTVRLLD